MGCDIILRALRKSQIDLGQDTESKKGPLTKPILYSKCSHFCTSVNSLYMWMFFKLVSEKHDFGLFNNYSLSGGGFIWKETSSMGYLKFSRGVFKPNSVYISLIFYECFLSFFLSFFSFFKTFSFLYFPFSLVNLILFLFLGVLMDLIGNIRQ